MYNSWHIIFRAVMGYYSSLYAYGLFKCILKNICQLKFRKIVTSSCASSVSHRQCRCYSCCSVIIFYTFAHAIARNGMVWHGMVWRIESDALSEHFRKITKMHTRIHREYIIICLGYAKTRSKDLKQREQRTAKKELRS